MLSQLISLNKRIVFQWIQSHCGILGNENADALAKKGSTASYRPVTKSTYYSVNRFIKSTYLDFNKQNLITQSQGKKWNSLHHNLQLIPDLPRKLPVAAFRLVTGHDCLAKHLHRIGIYQSPNCPLCNSNQEMDSEHLKICASVQRPASERARDIVISPGSQLSEDKFGPPKVEEELKKTPLPGESNRDEKNLLNGQHKRRSTVHSNIIQTVMKYSALRSMAQKERNTSWKLKYLVSQYGADIFCILNKDLYYKLCNVNITSAKNKEYNVQRHVSTMKHKGLEQGNVQKDPISNSTFYEVMCEAFIPADIPFNKLANMAFREFYRNTLEEKFHIRLCYGSSTSRKFTTHALLRSDVN
ncbi:hypothetical protein ANN_19331 [Periplaneta americana]|uniref:RNase H type-1 domain-containing protein n=1 Tax=Periplaneta americana TaxID=6978 RepID=A0ABQ8SAI4_PERAM|nr:hypothetical protein ANN_19331 [Periplaneta americana]